MAARGGGRRAWGAAGREFRGLFRVVCCSLRRLEHVARARRWPRRSAKVVPQLGLASPARHYGYATEARGKSQAPMRTWRGSDVGFELDGACEG